MKIKFFYLHGTDPLLRQVATILGEVFQQPRLGLITIAGLNGVTATWQDGFPKNDCFTNLLDPTIFDAVKVNYPALGFPMGVSLGIGIGNLQNAITSLPKGQKFMIGGYSQGAAAASSVELMLRPGGSMHADRGADYLGGVCFGNPRRQLNYRGEVGGTWSGAWDIPGSDTGGHGSFPTTGPYARLTGCDPTRWVEFTEVDDIFSSVGDSQRGLNWVAGNGAFLANSLADVLTAIGGLVDISAAFDLAGVSATVTDAIGKVFPALGNGHGAYPFNPPPGDPDSGLTSYQIAIKWLLSKAAEVAVAPILLPSQPTTTANAGWSSTLVPPAL